MTFLPSQKVLELKKQQVAEIKELVASLSKTIPNIKRNLFKALNNPNQLSIWHPKESN